MKTHGVLGINVGAVAELFIDRADGPLECTRLHFYGCYFPRVTSTGSMFLLLLLQRMSRTGLHYRYYLLHTAIIFVPYFFIHVELYSCSCSDGARWRHQFLPVRTVPRPFIRGHDQAPPFLALATALLALWLTLVILLHGLSNMPMTRVSFCPSTTATRIAAVACLVHLY